MSGTVTDCLNWDRRFCLYTWANEWGACRGPSSHSAGAMLQVLPMPRALPPARGAVGPSLHTPPSQGARSASGAKVSRSRACGPHPSTCTGHREPVEGLFKGERARRFSPRSNQGSALDTSVKPTNSNQRPQSTAARRRCEDDNREERALLRRHQWSSSREGFAPALQTSGNV